MITALFGLRNADRRAAGLSSISQPLGLDPEGRAPNHLEARMTYLSYLLVAIGAIAVMAMSEGGMSLPESVSKAPKPCSRCGNTGVCSLCNGSDKSCAECGGTGLCQHCR